MEKSKLSNHKFFKGKFITPMNLIEGLKYLPEDKAWFTGRLPEYLWLGLILNKFGRKLGMNKAMHILQELHILAPSMIYPKLSNIFLLSPTIQKKFYEKIKSNTTADVLSPLTLIYTISKKQTFAEMFFDSNTIIEERKNILLEIMKINSSQHSNEATDIRFLILYFQLIADKLKMPEEMLIKIQKYIVLEHSAEEMKEIRPSIRASEIVQFEEANKDFLNNFWYEVSMITECESFIVKFESENNDTTTYVKNLCEIFYYLDELQRNINPLDEKMSVIMGIAIYSYKRFKELCYHNLYNAISGRSIIRVLIENFIMIKYLLTNESTHTNIWHDYKMYGIGLYKMVLCRHREKGLNLKSHFNSEYIDILVNEYFLEETIDMDTKYFDKQGIRQKAEVVNEKELYGLYYDYDSSFEHGLWGAIRESSLLKCNNPTHQFHLLPDIDCQQNLTSVLPDCIMVINKTVSLLDDLYGIPSHLLEPVLTYEV